ncbi:MAG: SMI1/KNR4 family protein [Pseudomonas sp.]|uniref:SMI1/KNR4 family protein n=1 Tax=Pseudomonas sp. TaxID=306 RepID=UPI003398FFF1
MSTELSDTPWPPAGCPPLAWPELPNPETRLAWYRAVIDAYGLLWEGHVSAPKLAPVDEASLAALEARLGCALPPALRCYHSELGVLSLGERLCSVQPGDICIQPLSEAFPGIVDIATSETELELAAEMIAFGDYLGNGNMFCFHRVSGEVFYFDHDQAPLLCRFFTSPETYLDALMLRTLAEVHEDDEGGIALLEARFGRDLVTKWLF